VVGKRGRIMILFPHLSLTRRCLPLATGACRWPQERFWPGFRAMVLVVARCSRLGIEWGGFRAIWLPVV